MVEEMSTYSKRVRSMHCREFLLSHYADIYFFRATKFIAVGLALVIALLFLWGGLATSKSINSPETPMLVDAVLCYIPMAIIGYWLALRSRPKRG